MATVIVPVLATFASPVVWAYIDPGSGSAIVSAIIGFFVALLLALKTYWYKFKSLFTRKASDDDPGTGAAGGT